MFYGKKFPRPAKTGGNFIINHKHTVLIAELTKLF